MTADFEQNIIEDCYSRLLSYEYVNTSTTIGAVIVYSLWEVRNSSNELLIYLETPSLSNLTYAFPYLDTFTVRLTARDSLLNQDIKTETYIVSECPAYPDGAPSAPALAEKYKTVRKISVKNISSKYLDECPIDIKVRKVKDINI